MDVMSLEEIDALELQLKVVNDIAHLSIHVGKWFSLCHTARAYHTQAAYITKLEVERGELLSAAEVANARIVELEAAIDGIRSDLKKASKLIEADMGYDAASHVDSARGIAINVTKSD